MISQETQFDINQLIANLLQASLLQSLLLILLLTVLTWFIGKVFKLIVRRFPKISPDLKNGIILATSITQLVILTLGTFFLLGQHQEALVAISTVSATVIGLASISVASNIFGGLYLLVTRPFKVGDMIRVSDSFGIVEEIGLHFTRIIQLDRTIVTIPNSNLLSASLLNYNIPGHDIWLQPIEILDKKMRFGILSPDYRAEDPCVRFRWMIALSLNAFDPPLTIPILRERLDKICDEYTPIFGYKPDYYLGRHDFRQNVFIVITAPNAYTIFNSWKFLMESIVKTVFAELQKEKV
ncbi:MAG: mechanosensitive ion channel domain-containing protein [Candidatus Hodarchaeales archaeon]